MKDKLSGRELKGRTPCAGTHGCRGAQTLAEAAEAHHSSLLAPSLWSSQTPFPQSTLRVQMLLCSGWFCSKISPGPLCHFSRTHTDLTAPQNLHVVLCSSISLLASLWPPPDFPLTLSWRCFLLHQHGRGAPAALHMDINARLVHSLSCHLTALNSLHCELRESGADYTDILEPCVATKHAE